MNKQEAIKLLICEKACVEDVDGNVGGERVRQAYDMAIEALQDDWISITEAEPNTPAHVLVTYKWGNDDYEVSELDYWITKYEAENGNAQCKMFIDHVIAWRYMLAPYKGGDTE